MENTYKKISESEIEITKPEVVEAKTATYDVAFLKQQLINIQTQKDKDNAQRDAEIAEVETLLSECVKLKIKEVKEEVLPIEEEVLPVEEIIK